MTTDRWSRRPSGGGCNLVGLAKPYFGLIVLTTVLLTGFGVVSMLRMPSGIYPEVAFPRIVVIAQSPGLAVKDVEVAITRPIEEAVSIVLGVIRVRSKSVRGATELSIDFAPGTDMIQALNDVRARMAEVGAQLPAGTTYDHRTADPVGLSHHLLRRDRRARSGIAPRLCLLRPEAADQPDRGRLVRDGPGRGHPGDPRRGRPAGPGGRRALHLRRRRPPRQGASPEGGRPARSRGPPVSGARGHAGDRPLGPRRSGHCLTRTASRSGCATSAG